MQYIKIFKLDVIILLAPILIILLVLILKKINNYEV